MSKPYRGPSIFDVAAQEWWDTLTIDEKTAYKKGFEKYCKTDIPYPNMYNLTNYRISQLSMKHITRIYTFKDRIL